MHTFIYIIQITAALLANIEHSGSAEENHLEVVKTAVRKFFQRADPEDKGLVSEERFRAFCWYAVHSFIYLHNIT